MYLSEKRKLEEFLRLRDTYINELESGKISKQEFNLKNYMIFKKLSLKPFSVLDSFEKALYNYNYYNSKAKISLEEANNAKANNNLKRYKFHMNNKNNYYRLKDEATMTMIQSVSPLELEAYFIKLHSKNLKESIYEINFFDINRCILHSKDESILEYLKRQNIFKEEVRLSIIDDYVNSN